MSDFTDSDDLTEPVVNRRESMADDLNDMLVAEQQIDDIISASEEDVVDDVDDYDDSEIEEPPSYYQLGEMQIPADQVNDVVGLVQWASSLTPEQADRINRALTGDFDQAETSTVPAVENAEPVDQVPSYIAELEQTDPTMARFMREMHDDRVAREREIQQKLDETLVELGQLEAITGRQLVEATYEQTNTVENQVREEFLADNNLSPEDYDVLVATASELNLTNPMVEAYGLEEGFRRTLEAALYANEDLRDRSFRNNIESEIRSELTSQKKEAAAGLAPQGGTNLPTSTPAGLPQSERRSAMVRDIEALMGMQP